MKYLSSANLCHQTNNNNKNSVKKEKKKKKNEIFVKREPLSSN